MNGRLQPCEIKRIEAEFFGKWSRRGVGRGVVRISCWTELRIRCDMRSFWFVVFCVAGSVGAGRSTVTAQGLPVDPVHREWTASWITHPTAALRNPLVLHFRRAVRLEAVPASYVVRVSADNRFILWVNGKRAGDGPARGDLGHWRYEKFDLAQMSDRTAFLLESEATGDAGISTPDGWMVEEEPGHRPLDRTSVTLQEYFASGPGEEIDAEK